MSETPLYDTFMRQHKTIIKRFGNNSARDKEIFFFICGETQSQISQVSY